MFAAHGYAGAGLAGLAERAGLSKAAVLHHFRNKEALYLEVMGSTLGALVDPVIRAAAEPGGYAERLDRLTSAVGSELADRPEAAKLLLGEILGRGPFIAGPGRTAVTEGLQSIVAFLQAGMDGGEFRRQDARQLAWSIMGIHLLYFAARDAVEPPAPDAAAARVAAVHQHVRSLTLAGGGSDHSSER